MNSNVLEIHKNLSLKKKYKKGAKYTRLSELCC